MYDRDILSFKTNADLCCRVYCTLRVFRDGRYYLQLELQDARMKEKLDDRAKFGYARLWSSSALGVCFYGPEERFGSIFVFKLLFFECR